MSVLPEDIFVFRGVPTRTPEECELREKQED